MSTTTHFKLTHSDGYTRRLAFPSQPTWGALAARIGYLYTIPIDNVSVAYIDTDGDEVTLNSQEEIEDFYQASHQPGEVIKFLVQDLRSSRTQSKALPETPRTPNIRNTFGQEEPFGIEDDWQRLPPFSGLGGLFVPRSSGADSPHAYVEVVDSNASIVSDAHDANTDSGSAHSTVHSKSRTQGDAPPNKGKGKAIYDDEISSTGSVLAEDAPPKHPLHVYDIAPRAQPDAEPFNIFKEPVITPCSQSPSIAIVAESTPKPVSQVLADRDEKSETIPKVSESPGDIADPPLPSLPDIPSATPPSLPNDVTYLLTTFNNIITAHPELSEGVHNIIRNASNGTYWNTHRDAISQAAGQFAQTAGGATEELRKGAEEEAGKRVADALGGVFRTLSQTMGIMNPPLVQTPPAPTAGEGHGEGHELPEGETQSAPPNIIPPKHDVPVSSQESRGRRDGIPPPPPSGPPHNPFFSPGMHGAFGPPHPWKSWVPHHPHGPHFHGPSGMRGEPIIPDQGLFFQGTWERGQVPFGAPPPPPPPPPPPMVDLSHLKPTPQELRAQVEAAKSRYKAEKERYRQEREERKKERERRARTTDGETAADPQPTDTTPPIPVGPPHKAKPSIVSHARGEYPALELVSVRRNNTHPTHGPPVRRNGLEHGDLTSRTLHRISKRLADMGFTENTYRDLPTKIKSQMPPSGVVTKDGEDDIVTTLLEELLAMSPKPPAAAGFNVGDRDIPGSWH